jgi:hypothetical protein
MGKVLERIDEPLAEWIRSQHVYFVGTAPSHGGHVNVSPKGPISTFRVIDDHTVEYDDRVGSGAETAAHLRDDGRICVMFCAFAGPPRIVRLHGRGELITLDDPGPGGQRSIVRVHVDRVSDSCGFGVPLMEYTADRTQFERWVESKSDEGLRDYIAEKNSRSIDGLPAFGD